jgi:small nuclear ribonucleoprotein (snRNP)-like protein
MNVVMSAAEEVWIKGQGDGQRKELGAYDAETPSFRSMLADVPLFFTTGRILLKSDNITLIQPAV